MAYLIISHRNITVNIYFHILVATHSSLKSPKPLTSLHLIQIRAWNFGLDLEIELKLEPTANPLSGKTGSELEG